jgi:hypothetical protein
MRSHARRQTCGSLSDGRGRRQRTRPGARVMGVDVIEFKPVIHEPSRDTLRTQGADVPTRKASSVGSPARTIPESDQLRNARPGDPGRSVEELLPHERSPCGPGCTELGHAVLDDARTVTAPPMDPFSKVSDLSLPDVVVHTHRVGTHDQEIDVAVSATVSASG